MGILTSQAIFLDMDNGGTNFEMFIINMRSNYTDGLMKKYRCVYYCFTTQERDWHKVGQENGSSIYRPNR